MYLKSLGIIWDVKEKKRIIVILFFCGAGGIRTLVQTGNT